MIDWKQLVGETGLVEFVHPFLVVGHHGGQAVPLGVGPHGAGVLGTSQDLQPMVTQFLAPVEVVAFDEDTGGLTLRYVSPINNQATGARLELHTDAANVAYFVRANRITVAQSVVAAER